LIRVVAVKVSLRAGIGAQVAQGGELLGGQHAADVQLGDGAAANQFTLREGDGVRAFDDGLLARIVGIDSRIEFALGCSKARNECASRRLRLLSYATDLGALLER